MRKLQGPKLETKSKEGNTQADNLAGVEWGSHSLLSLTNEGSWILMLK